MVAKVYFPSSLKFQWRLRMWWAAAGGMYRGQVGFRGRKRMWGLRNAVEVSGHRRIKGCSQEVGEKGQWESGGGHGGGIGALQPCRWAVGIGVEMLPWTVP